MEIHELRYVSSVKEQGMAKPTLFFQSHFLVGLFVLGSVSFVPGFALGKDLDNNQSVDAVFANSQVEGGSLNKVCLNIGVEEVVCAEVSSGDVNSSQAVALADVDPPDPDNEAEGGTVDAVFANNGINKLCLGDGEGGFSTPCRNISDNDANNSQGVALTDVDRDSLVDIVFANSGGPSRVCLGNGAGAFPICRDVASAATNNSQGVALADMNRDLLIDAVFANSGAANRVCLGDGAGMLACQDVSDDANEANNSQAVALADVDANGTIDAVFANSGTTNRVCLGDGMGRFDCRPVSDDMLDSRGVALAIPDPPQ